MICRQQTWCRIRSLERFAAFHCRAEAEALWSGEESVGCFVHKVAVLSGFALAPELCNSCLQLFRLQMAALAHRSSGQQQEHATVSAGAHWARGAHRGGFVERRLDGALCAGRGFTARAPALPDSRERRLGVELLLFAEQHFAKVRRMES